MDSIFQVFQFFPIKLLLFLHLKHVLSLVSLRYSKIIVYQGEITKNLITLVSLYSFVEVSQLLRLLISVQEDLLFEVYLKAINKNLIEKSVLFLADAAT
mgnify:CR=1 FL=1